MLLYLEQQTKARLGNVISQALLLGLRLIISHLVPVVSASAWARPAGCD